VATLNERPVPGQAVLDALIALNSWARSREATRGLNRGLRRAIYHYKNAALRALIQGGVDLSPRLVYAEAQCRDCGGSGCYYDGDCDRELDHCYRCHSTGKVRLEFIQATLPGGAIWHSPREYLKCPTCLLSLVEGREAEPAGESWNVGREGKALDFQSLAGALNQVEDWHGIPARHAITWQDDEPSHYYLPLGVRPRTCAFCDGPLAPDPMQYIASDGMFLSWGDWCCASCRKWFGPEFPSFAVPVDLLTEEAGVWLARREKWTRKQPRFSEKTGAEHVRAYAVGEEMPF